MLAPSRTVVSCAPVSAAAGSATIVTCAARVTGYKPSGTVAWHQSGAGTVSFASSVCSLSGRRCSVTMTGATAGPLSVIGVYGGDANNGGSAGNRSVTVRPARPSFSVSCAQPAEPVNSTVPCTASLAGFAGSVGGDGITWLATGAGAVSFSSHSCDLTSGGTCSVNATGTGAGVAEVRATYGGDANNAGRTRSTALRIGKATTTVTVSCSPGSVSIGSQTACTATVSGYSPTGTVTWSKSGGSGRVRFLSTVCVLVAGSCAVNLSATGSGVLVVRAFYHGDVDNSPGSGTFLLTVS